MNFQAIYIAVTLGIGSILAFASAIVAISMAPQKYVNRLWFMVAFLSGVWSGGYALMVSTASYDVAWFGINTMHVVATAIPVFLLHFIAIFTNSSPSSKRYLRYVLGLFYSVAILFMILTFSPLLIADVTLYYGFYHPTAGPLYPLYLLYFWTTTVTALVLTLRALKKTSGNKQQQLKYLALAEVSGFVGGGWVFFLYYNLNITVLPTALFPLFPVVVGYAIARYRLFGMRFVANKAFVLLGLGLVTYVAYYAISYFYIRAFGSIFSLPAYSIGVGIAIAFAALIVNPVTARLREWGDKLFYRGYNPHHHVASAIATLKDSESLEQLHAQLNHLFYNAFGIPSTDLVLFLEENGLHYSSARHCHYDLAVLQRLRTISSVHRCVLTRDDEILQMSQATDRALFATLNIAVAIPLFKRQGSYPAAFILIDSEHKRSYHSEDVQFLEQIRQGVGRTFGRLCL